MKAISLKKKGEWMGEFGLDYINIRSIDKGLP